MSTSVTSDLRVQPLLKGPILPMLLRLAGPNVVAVALMTAVAIADALFVGQLGTVPLASLALVFPFQTLMQMMSAATLAFYVLSAIVCGTGDTVTPARTIIVGSAVQVALSGALTLGRGPFPKFWLA